MYSNKITSLIYNCNIINGEQIDKNRKLFMKIRKEF